MVSQKEILDSNSLINDANVPQVALFVGGTSGIGKLTIRALVATGTSVRIYIVGRKSAQESTRTFIQELNALNAKAEIVWIEAEIALLAENKRVCELIKSKESRLDLMFLTAGYAAFDGRFETVEGIEITQSLEYYSRILAVIHLLPLLKQAEAPRVVAVLAGGLEKNVDLEDLDLKKPGSFGVVKAQGQFGAMNTLALEKLAIDNPDITFMHSWPGWINTGNVKRGVESNPNSIKAWLVWLFLEPLIALIAIRDEDAGQRYLFESTSAYYGGRGVPWTGKPGVNSFDKEENGLFLVNYKCDTTPNASRLPSLRERAAGKVWDHTQEVLGPYL